jgi:hypothetical protein
MDLGMTDIFEYYGTVHITYEYMSIYTNVAIELDKEIRDFEEIDGVMFDAARKFLSEYYGLNTNDVMDYSIDYLDIPFELLSINNDEKD